MESHLYHPSVSFKSEIINSTYIRGLLGRINNLIDTNLKSSTNVSPCPSNLALLASLVQILNTLLNSIYHKNQLLDTI